MSYRLVYKKLALEDVGRLSHPVKQRIGAKLLQFATSDNPLALAKRLTKPADAQYRFRVGDYRVLFDVEGQELVILRIQHRREVYRR